jgi:hypothetical protein
LMLSLLHLIQVQTDCFLLYCDCTIELCCTIVSHSVYHHRWWRLTHVYTAFRLCAIRLKKIYTNKNRRETRQTIFVRRIKHASDSVAVIGLTTILFTNEYESINLFLN